MVVGKRRGMNKDYHSILSWEIILGTDCRLVSLAGAHRTLPALHTPMRTNLRSPGIRGQGFFFEVSASIRFAE